MFAKTVPFINPTKDSALQRHVPQPCTLSQNSRHPSTSYVAFERSLYVRYAVPWIEPSLSPEFVPVPEKTSSYPLIIRFESFPNVDLKLIPRLVSPDPASVSSPSTAVTTVAGTGWLGGVSSVGPLFWETTETVESMVFVSVVVPLRSSELSTGST